MSYLIKEARVLSPADGLDDILDILISDGKIIKIGKNISSDGEIFDARGLIAVPGFIDIHCHLREPGYEYKETIKSGTAAAKAGGFTAVACMANTNPVNDNAAITYQILAKAQKEGSVDVLPIGAITHGLKGKQLVEMGEMLGAGCVAFSDDGVSIHNSQMMRLALQYAMNFDALLISHCEQPELSNSGYMNEGYMSTILGLRGIPSAAEEVMVSRDILLAQSLDTKVHVTHISSKGSVDIIRNAKALGIKVTADTCPHYIMGTDAMVEQYDTNTKVNPPLRTEEDKQAIINGLSDGTIDCIGTDHAPHHMDDKRLEYQLAANGISGFETAFALSYTGLKEEMDIAQIIKLLTVNPADILNVNKGRLKLNGQADITLIDLDKKWTVDVNKFISKGKNNPFHGHEVIGKVIRTFYRGE